MSDGKGTLKKIAFQIGSTFFRFAINPQNLRYSRPHRTTAVKTKSRIVIEDFQDDIPTITISGTMGFNPTGKAADRGSAKMKELKEFLNDYSQMGGNGNTNVEDFIFHDFTNDESWVVTLGPEGFDVTQDVSQPLLHTYEIKLIILRDAALPADDQVVNPEIGNPYPSIATNGTIPPSNYGTVQLPPLNPYVPGIGITPPPSIQQGSVSGTYNNGVTTPNSGSSSSSGSSSNGGSNPKPYDPTSGNPNIYNSGTTGPYVPSQNGNDPINPQAPSPNAYHYGMTGLGFNIGYYGRGY
jgi:hypothetical protein